MMTPMPTASLKLMSDRAGYYTRWTDDCGNRHKRRFGAAKNKARVAFAEFFARWQTDDAVRNPSQDGPVTVDMLWDRFNQHAQDYYVNRHGKPTREATNIAHAMREVLRMFGDSKAEAFDAKRLRAARDAMIKAGLARNTINQRVRKIRSVFRWGNAEGIVPADVVVSLESVKALSAYRTKARETKPVEAVADSVVDATADACPPTLAAMIRVQRLTGMRPGEVCIMRACDIDMAGKVWVYTPHDHKTAHRGKSRGVCIGPAAQSIIQPYIGRDLTAYLFTPRRAMIERQDARAAAYEPSGGAHDYRNWQSYRNRRARRYRGGRLRDHYTENSYLQAVYRACDAAGVPRWSPNKLRHAWSTEQRKRGVPMDVIMAQLGHSHIKTTEGYAQIDATKAADWMVRYG